MFALPFLALTAAVPLQEIVRVVAPISLQLAVFEGQDRGDGFVEQWQVVRHDQHPSPVSGQPFDEPGLGVEVEMVGGLVEQQDVGLGEKDPGQFDPSPLTAGHGCHRLAQFVISDAQGGCHPLRLGLGDEPTLGFELVVEAPETAYPPVTLVTGQIVKPAPSVLDLALHGPDVAGHQDPLQGSGIDVLQLGKGGLLGEVTDGPGAQHRSVGRVELSGQGAHQCGLAGSVAAHEPDAVSGLHTEGDPIDQSSRAGIDTEVACDQHQCFWTRKR